MSWRFDEDGRIMHLISLSDLISIQGSKMHFEALNWQRISHDVIMQDSSRSEEQGRLNFSHGESQAKPRIPVLQGAVENYNVTEKGTTIFSKACTK